MESSNYEWLITDTVEAMLPRFSDRKLVLVMCVDMEWTDHGYAEDGNTKIRDTRTFRKNIWLVFHRPSNYTKVLVTDQELKSFNLDGDAIQFKKYSDHDSCWRSDGFRWMFQSFVDAWDYFEQFGVEGREIDPRVNYSVFGGKPSYWLIDKIEPVNPVNPKDRWVTDYMVKFNKKLSINEAVEYMPKTKLNKGYLKMSFDVQDKSVKDRLSEKVRESMTYMLQKTNELSDAYIALAEKFFDEKWDTIWDMYNAHFPGAELEKMLDIMESPEYIKMLDFNVVYQMWLNKELSSYMEKHQDEINAIIDRQYAEETDVWEAEPCDEDSTLRDPEKYPYPECI